MAITNQPKSKKVYLTETEAAEYLGLKAGTLRNWRKDGVGPAYSRLGRCVRYTAEDLEKFASDRRFNPDQF
jgi:excisionase family DNA binding protein